MSAEDILAIIENAKRLIANAPMTPACEHITHPKGNRCVECGVAVRPGFDE